MSLGDTALQDTWILDLLARTWFNVTFEGVVPPARFGHDASPLTNLQAMLIFGGLIPSGGLDNRCSDGALAQVNGTYGDDTWILHPSNGTVSRQWQRVPAGPGAGPVGRAGHALSTTTAGVLLFGGVAPVNTSSNSSAEARRETSEQRERGSSARRGGRRIRSGSSSSGAQSGDGYDHRDEHEASPDGDVLALELVPLNDTWLYGDSGWTRVAAGGDVYPPSRHSHISVTMNMPPSASAPRSAKWTESVVVFGGTSNCHVPVISGARFFNDLWVFNVATRTWYEVPPPPTGSLPAGRHSHSGTVSGNGTLIIYGGE